MDKHIQPRWLLAAGIASSFAASLVIGPSDLAVNDHGEPDGWYQELKAAVQGDRYWRGQVEFARHDLRFWIELPEEQAKLEAEVRPVLEEAKREAAVVMSQFRSELPPKSDMELRAQRLRSAAERLEGMANTLSAQAFRRTEIDRLQRLIRILRTKYQPTSTK